MPSIDASVHVATRRLPLWRDALESLLLVMLLAWMILGPAYLFTRSHDLRDFETFYASGQAWWAGHDLYVSTGENMNPPAFVVLTAPFALLPMRVSLVVWWIANGLAAAFAIGVIRRETGLQPTRVHLLLALAFAGTRSQIFLGQVAWLLMVPATLGWRAYRRKDDVRAGAWWGVLIALKPILLPILLGLLWRRRYRALAAAVATGAAVCVFGLAGGGIAGYRSWVDAGHGVFWFFRELNASILGVLSRFDLAPALRTGLWAVMSAAVIVASWWRRRVPDADADVLTWVLVSLLVAPLGWVYYLPVALGPLVAVAGRRQWPGWAWVALAGLFWPPGVLWADDPVRTPALLASVYAASTLFLWWFASAPAAARIARAPREVFLPQP